MGTLKNQKVVILGGTSGIGLATAIASQKAGAVVWACSRSANKVAEAGKTAPQVNFLQVDIHDVPGLAKLFQDTGPIDHVVATATGAERTIAPFMEQTADQFRAAFDKFWGYTNLVRACVPHLSATGSITLTSGSPARKCNPGASSLSCVGGAVENFARALALELAPKRVNLVSPGLIDTGMFAHFADKKDEILNQLTQKLPINRPGRSEELAEAILLCMTNGYMTGATIDVDGGTLLP